MSGPIGRPWTAQEDQKLVEMRAAGAKTQHIADALKRTNRSVRARTTDRIAAGETSVHPAKNPWTDEQDHTLRTLLAEGRRYKQIAPVIGRSYPAIKARVAYLKLITPDTQQRRQAKPKATAPWSPVRVEHEQVRNVVVPEEVLADRNRRLMAQRDLTAILMGDPVSGFSALDRRRA